MNLAWTADNAPPSVGVGRRAASPALARLADLAPDELVVPDDRELSMRVLYERRHADMVRFAAFLSGDVGTAEDIAQEAFAKVFDAWDRISDRALIDAYLKSTVVNLVRDAHRKKQVADRRGTSHLSVVQSAEDDVVGRIGRERVLAAVAELPLRQRACVVMRHWMRMTESEIAHVLELSVGSVRTHVKRGTETLKTSLGDER